jgi:hypothetical protein
VAAEAVGRELPEHFVACVAGVQLRVGMQSVCVSRIVDLFVCAQEGDGPVCRVVRHGVRAFDVSALPHRFLNGQFVYTASYMSTQCHLTRGQSRCASSSSKVNLAPGVASGGSASTPFSRCDPTAAGLVCAALPLL